MIVGRRRQPRSSALVAVVFQEPGYELIIDKLVESNATGIGTPTLAETGIVLDARLRKDSRSRPCSPACSTSSTSSRCPSVSLTGASR